MVSSNRLSLIPRTSIRTNTTEHSGQKDVPDPLWGLLCTVVKMGRMGRCRAQHR